MEVENDRTDDKDPIWGLTELDSLRSNIPFPSCRGILAWTCCFGFFNVFALRVNLSVAMVAMVNSSYSEGNINNATINECPGKPLNTNSSTSSEGEFNWSNELQGYILGSFFYGYITTQILGGRLAERYGTKWLFGGSVLCTSALSILTPVVARWSPYAFIVLRVLEGIGEGVSFPVMYVMLAQWCPPLERSRLNTIVFSGTQMGTIIAMLLSGVISVKSGWDWVFYIFGIFGCVWCFAFWFLVYDTPAVHPRITTEERTYIEKAIGPHSARPPVPWRAIMTSAPFWAIIIVQFTFYWGGYTLLTSLPKYLHDVLHFNLAANGFLSSLPYMVQYFAVLLGGQMADWLLLRKVLSVTVVRKLATSIGMSTAAISLLVVSYTGCDHVTTMAFLIIGTGCSSFAQSGYATNYLDIAPVFTGTMMGIANTFGNISGFLAPQVVGWLTNEEASSKQWQKVFFIAVGLYCFGILSYLILASGKEQEWANPRTNEETGDTQQTPPQTHNSTPNIHFRGDSYHCYINSVDSTNREDLAAV